MTTTLITSAPRVKNNPLEATGEAVVRVRKAIGLVRAATYVALSVRMNDINCSLVDVPKTTALRTLRRLRDRIGNHALVHCSDVFGTLVLGL